MLCPNLVIGLLIRWNEAINQYGIGSRRMEEKKLTLAIQKIQ
jgi:hypothetical protein